MGTSLTGTKIRDTYDALIKVSDNGALDATLQVLTDGLGNNSALSLSTAGASVGGTLAVSGAATLSSTLGVSGAASITGSLTVQTTTERANITTNADLATQNGIGVLSTSTTYGQGYQYIRFFNSSAAYAGSISQISSTGIGLYSGFSADLILGANSTERMRIYSGGDVSFRDSSANEAFYWDASAASLGIGINNSAYGNLGVYNSSNPLIGIANSTSYAQLQQNGSDFYINTNLSGAVGGNTVFRRGAGFTESMRITSGGYLKACDTGEYVYPSTSFHEITNTSNNNTALFIAHRGASTPYGIDIKFTAASPNNTTNYFLYATDSASARCIIYSNGNVVNSNNSYGAISDAKLKENVVDASPKLEDLMQVKVRNFNYIGDDKKQLGVVAQELEEVFPSMIDESPDYEEVEVPQLDENGQEVLDENGEVVMTKEKVDLGTVTKSVKYSVFVPMLIKAIQELNAKVESLEAQLNA